MYRDLGTEGAADADVALRKCLSSGRTDALIPGPRYFCASRAIVPTGSYGTFTINFAFLFHTPYPPDSYPSLLLFLFFLLFASHFPTGGLVPHWFRLLAPLIIAKSADGVRWNAGWGYVYACNMEILIDCTGPKSIIHVDREGIEGITGADVADGRDECIKAVRRQIGAGADWIKVCVSVCACMRVFIKDPSTWNLWVYSWV